MRLCPTSREVPFSTPFHTWKRMIFSEMISLIKDSNYRIDENAFTEYSSQHVYHHIHFVYPNVYSVTFL